MGDWIEHDAMPVGAQTDERSAGADQPYPCVVPRHMTAPPQLIGGWVGRTCALTAQ